jgi:hypothetical protein
MQRGPAYQRTRWSIVTGRSAGRGTSATVPDDGAALIAFADGGFDPRFHLSIANVMAVMIPLALGLAAWQSASQLWVDIVFNLVVAALLIATYKAKCSQGIEGAWWLGFAAFGWAHLVLGLVGVPWGQHFGVRPEIVTADVTWRVVALVEPDPTPDFAQRATARALVVHCFVCLLLSLLGAAVFGFFAARRTAPG